MTYGSGSYMTTYFGVTPADAQASGLPAYQPDAGLRDVRGWVGALVHLSPRWSLGAGVVYLRLADEAARSPHHRLRRCLARDAHQPLVG